MVSNTHPSLHASNLHHRRRSLRYKGFPPAVHVYHLLLSWLPTAKPQRSVSVVPAHEVSYRGDGHARRMNKTRVLGLAHRPKGGDIIPFCRAPCGPSCRAHISAICMSDNTPHEKHSRIYNDIYIMKTGTKVNPYHTSSSLCTQIQQPLVLAAPRYAPGRPLTIER